MEKESLEELNKRLRRERIAKIAPLFTPEAKNAIEYLKAQFGLQGGRSAFHFKEGQSDAEFLARSHARMGMKELLEFISETERMTIKSGEGTE